MTRKRITLRLGCIVCETCSNASMTMKLHKEVDHKNSELVTNLTFFFNRRNQLIREKMFPALRSMSSRQFLHPSVSRQMCDILNQIFFKNIKGKGNISLE